MGTVSVRLVFWKAEIQDPGANVGAFVGNMSIPPRAPGALLLLHGAFHTTRTTGNTTGRFFPSFPSQWPKKKSTTARDEARQYRPNQASAGARRMARARSAVPPSVVRCPLCSNSRQQTADTSLDNSRQATKSTQAGATTALSWGMTTSGRP